MALSQQRLEEWLASDISQLDLLGVQIGGLHVAEDVVLIGAIGIDGKGDKHILGLVEGATEIAAASQALLDKLIERAGSTRRCRAYSFSMERKRSRRRSAPHSAVKR